MTEAVAEQSAPVELNDENLEVQNTPEATAAKGDVETKQEEPAKTFTQAEVDALIQKRLLKEERRVHRRIEQQLREQQQAQVLTEEPKRESFRDDEAFTQAQIEHLAEVKAAQKLAERERAQQQERLAETFIEKTEKARERFSDFDQTIASIPATYMTEAMVEFIVESEVAADLSYYLGKNPTKAAQIAALSPIKAARELTRIEAELASKPQAKPSQAPEPINPVGSRSKSSSSPLPSDADDIDTWMRKERERVRRG